jgi:hypothetical protein
MLAKDYYFCFLVAEDDEDGDDYGSAGPSGAQEAGEVAHHPASQEPEEAPFLPVNSEDYTAAGSSEEIYLLRAAMGKNK